MGLLLACRARSLSSVSGRRSEIKSFGESSSLSPKLRLDCRLAARRERRVARLRLARVDDRVVGGQAARGGCLAAREGVEPLVAVRRRGLAVAPARGGREGPREE